MTISRMSFASRHCCFPCTNTFRSKPMQSQELCNVKLDTATKHDTNTKGKLCFTLALLKGAFEKH